MVASEGYQVDAQVNANYSVESRNFINDALNKMPNVTEYDTDSVQSGKMSDTTETFDEESIVSDKTVPETGPSPPVQDPSQLKRPVMRKSNQKQPPAAHPRIRRIPSTANPKYRTPILYKNQRTQSSPQIQANLGARRGSLPQSGNSKVAQVHPRRNSSPQVVNMGPLYQELMRQKGQIQQQIMQQTFPQKIPTQKPQTSPKVQQQVIYIQIPNLPQAQGYDSQILQSQISSQLQQLVPQIYSQLVNQYGHTQDNRNSSNSDRSKSPSTFSMTSGSSSENSFVSGEAIQNPEIQPHRKRKKSVDSRTNNFEVDTDSGDVTKGYPSEIPLLVQPEQLQQASIDLQHATGIPQITIPLSQELLLQCQQLRDPASTAYAPGLETIQEEAMSIKIGAGMSKVSKSKILACIVTVLSVIVVVVLAGDRTVAVVVVTVLFLVFFLGLVGFLYLNSAKQSSQGLIP